MDSNLALEGPVLRRNLVATLRTASLEGVLAIGGAHSDAKSVRLAPVAIVGLIGPFHGLKTSLVGLKR